MLSAVSFWRIWFNCIYFSGCFGDRYFFAASNKGNRIATVKIVAAVFFVLFLCMFIEIVRCGAEVAGAAGAYQYCSVHKIGGGFLGGLLAGIFVQILDSSVLM